MLMKRRNTLFLLSCLACIFFTSNPAYARKLSNATVQKILDAEAKKVTQISTPNEPEWQNLGEGIYHNAFFFNNDYFVSVNKDVNNPGHYRLICPYADGFRAEGYDINNSPDYVEFQILKGGETIPGTDIQTPTDDGGYLSIASHNTGFKNANDVELWAMYSAEFQSPTIEHFAGQRVLNWSTFPISSNDGYGEPGIISMGCVYYLQGTGSGYDYRTSTDMVTFTFPSMVGNDILTLKSLGITESDGNAKIKCSVNWHTNVIKEVKIAAVKVPDTYTTFSLYDMVDNNVAWGSTPSTTMTTPGEITLDLPEAGLYQIVAASFDASETSPRITRLWSKYTPKESQNGNWKSLGKGRYTNAFFSNTYDVEVQQDLDKPGRYRLVAPYTEALMTESTDGIPYRELMTAAVPDYVEFQLVKPGENFPTKDAPMTPGGDTNTTVYIQSHSMGWTYPSAPCEGCEMWGLYYANDSYQGTGDPCNGQRVVSWQKEPGTTSDDYGIPRVVGMGATYVMAGGGYIYNFNSFRHVQFEFPDVVADTKLPGMNFIILSEQNATAAVYKDGNPQGELTIPEKITINGKEYTVTAIKDPSFKNCNDLTSVTIPETVTEIDNEAFYGCNKLTSVNIPQAVTTIPAGCFSGCGFTSYTVPSHVTVIEASAFASNPLKSVTLHEGMTRIGTQAFIATDIPAIDIPASITDLDTHYDGTSSIKGSIGAPFTGCYALTHINVHPDNAKYSDIDGVLLSKDQSIMWKYPEGREQTSYVVPASVKIIAENAVYYNNVLEDVTFPEGLEYVGPYAFAMCTNLRAIKLPNSVKTLGMYAFNGCRSVTELQLSAGLKEIPEYAFSSLKITELEIPEGTEAIKQGGFGYCDKVTSIKLPSTLKSIGQSAFTVYYSLEEVISQNPEPPVCSYREYVGLIYSPFDSYQISRCVLKVPAGSKQAYQEAPVWKDFGLIDDSSSIDGVAADAMTDNTPVEWFNIHGMPIPTPSDINELAPGLYIKRQGSNSAKILIH